MSNKIDAPLTYEFELAGCGSFGSDPQGIIFSNYSEDADAYVTLAFGQWAQLKLTIQNSSGVKKTITFNNEAIREYAVHHYAITMYPNKDGVDFYIDGQLKETRYPGGMELPTADDFSHPFRIGGDYTEGYND